MNHQFPVLWILILSLFIASCARGPKEETDLKPPADPAPTGKQDHPLSVESLRKRKFGPVTLDIGQEVKGKPSYKGYLVSYVSEGFTLHAFLYVPVKASRSGKYPAIIVNHGYIPPAQYSTVVSYRNICEYYVSQGFLVFKPDYRGHAQSAGSPEGGPLRTIDYAIDVINLLEGVKAYALTDTDHIFLYGHSMGGEVALRVLEITGGIKAATLWAPVSAPVPENTLYFIRSHDPVSANRMEAELKAMFPDGDYSPFSPIDALQYIRVPLLLHHGTADESVPYEWSVTLAAELRKQGVDFTFYTYNGENHNFVVRSYDTVKKRDVEFFRRYLNAN